MILKDFFPTLLVAMIFFITILQLVDIFANLWRYLNAEVPLPVIGRISLLYIPKCISFSMPIGILFSISFTLGNYYANNELIAVFGSGFSLEQFTRPLLVCGLLLSIAGYYFEDRMVIPAFKEKNQLSKEVLGEDDSMSNSNVTVLSHRNTVIYNADFYNDEQKSLKELTILFLSPGGDFLTRVDADSARWEGENWVLHSVRIFRFDGPDSFMQERFQAQWTDERLDEAPDAFQRISREVDEMNTQEAKAWVTFLRRTGLPYKGALTEYYQRFSFALTPLIVAFLSCSLGGRFKKNILLMSLLSSLVLSVIYYVAQMIMVLLARLGYIPPLYGAWSAFLLFLIIGFVLYRTAQT